MSFRLLVVAPDHISNMQLAHGACNSRKWATIPITAIYDFVPRLESGQPDTEPDPPAAEFIDANEAATLLGIKPASVRYRCERGLFAGAINAGGRVWLIPRPTVAAASTVGRLRPGPKRKPRRQPP